MTISATLLNHQLVLKSENISWRDTMKRCCQGWVIRI